MREIKFRTWDKETKRMWFMDKGEPLRCGFVFTPYGYMTQGYPLPHDYSPANPIVMQYTGLKDKNGKEIYEEDICKASDGWQGTVEWTNTITNGVIGFWCHGSGLYSKDMELCEVIGNIYENPELLGGVSR